MPLFLPVQRSSDGGSAAGRLDRGPSPRQSIYHEAVVSRCAADVAPSDKTSLVNRALHRVRLNSPAAKRSASRCPRLDEGS